MNYRWAGPLPELKDCKQWVEESHPPDAFSHAQGMQNQLQEEGTITNAISSLNRGN